MELVATTETFPDKVKDVKEEPTARVHVVLTEIPLKRSRLFNRMMMGVTASATNVLRDCRPEFPVTLRV